MGVNLDLADKGIRVNAVNPGVTELHKTAGKENQNTLHALGRPGTVKDVAAMMAFVARFITG